MLWIVIGVAIGFAVAAWARSSTKKFEQDRAQRETRQAQIRLQLEEEALLAKLKSKDEV